MRAFTPSPEPTPEFGLVVETLALGVALALLGFALVWALLRLSNRDPSAMVTVTLAILTLVAILTFAITESEVLGTIAATGVGALAGAVTKVFDVRRKDEEGEDGDQPPAVG